MFEAVYVVIGIIFGALAVWIISVKTLRDSLNQELEKSTDLASQNAVLQERINGINEKNQEKIELLQKNKEQMTLEFKELANKILESNSEKFSTQNQENLSKMITPIKEQFSEFKKQIDDVYIKEAKDRSMLQAEIKSIKEINHQMSKDAKNLTSALKGESKKQGVWGEMILERVLENSGLREGEEYEREVSMEHKSDGSRYRPDVVVHLPDTRDIIIDAKTSLTAYEQYSSAVDEEQKEVFASQHLASMKKHIKELSEKDYTNLKGVETLDFIFMFVPIESALLMALEYDSTLFDHAFKKNVILVGPTTLMVSLRAVENTWKYEHQQRNAQEIAQRAGLLYDKFVGFIESVEKLGKQIGTVQKTYDDAFGKMHSGAGSITSQFKKLEKLGAATSKKLPEHINKQIEE
ncbi:MAG: DNA recombination protein RmuC [Sulfurimonas sp.]|nr:DNA recombination protein RmuC [Sulfurimonas sp.]